MSLSPYPRTRDEEDTANADAEEVIACEEGDFGEVETEVKGDGKGVGGQDWRKCCGYYGCEGDVDEDTISALDERELEVGLLCRRDGVGLQVALP